MEVFKFGSGAVAMVTGMGSVNEGPYMPTLELAHCEPGPIRSATPEEMEAYRHNGPQPQTVLQFPTKETLDNLINLLVDARKLFQPI